MKIRYGQYDKLFSNETNENNWIKMYFNFDGIFFFFLIFIWKKEKYNRVANKIDIFLKGNQNIERILQNSIEF